MVSRTTMISILRDGAPVVAIGCLLLASHRVHKPPAAIEQDTASPSIILRLSWKPVAPLACQECSRIDIYCTISFPRCETHVLARVVQGRMQNSPWITHSRPRHCSTTHIASILCLPAQPTPSPKRHPKRFRSGPRLPLYPLLTLVPFPIYSPPPSQTVPWTYPPLRSNPTGAEA